MAISSTSISEHAKEIVARTLHVPSIQEIRENLPVTSGRLPTDSPLDDLPSTFIALGCTWEVDHLGEWDTPIGAMLAWQQLQTQKPVPSEIES